VSLNDAGKVGNRKISLRGKAPGFTVISNKRKTTLVTGKAQRKSGNEVLRGEDGIDPEKRGDEKERKGKHTFVTKGGGPIMPRQ